MTELRSALDEAIGGDGRIVMLAGEPGIGKTRVVEELASEAVVAGAQVLGVCNQLGIYNDPLELSTFLSEEKFPAT